MAQDTEPISQSVVCGAVAEKCICIAAPDHAERGEPHLCKCSGSWRGSLFDDDFEVISWPAPILPGAAP